MSWAILRAVPGPAASTPAWQHGEKAIHGEKQTMGSNEVLQELAREVRQDTLQILAATQAAWLTWTWIIHGLHDEAKHSGEMYLLWKLCRLRKERPGRDG